MSWNIKTPGDYINGPLTVAGVATFNSQVTVNSTLQVTGNVAGQGALIGRDGSSGGATYGSNIGNTNINSPASGTIRFNVNNGTFAGLFDTSGRLLIGTTTAAAPLTVRAANGEVGRFGVPNGQTGYILIGRDDANSSEGCVLAYSSTNGDCTLASVGASHPVIFKRGGVGGTESARFNAVGALVLGGGNVSANGMGIAFPAAQSASTDANTLDDYEEGTWTPSVGGTATYTTQTGRYVKIGNRVFLTLRMTINSIGTGDDYRILGLPFQPAAALGAASVGFFANLKITANFISGYASTGGAVITMTGTTAASGNITNGIGVFGNSSDIVMSCFYEV